jgi:hypothetical protein
MIELLGLAGMVDVVGNIPCHCLPAFPSGVAARAGHRLHLVLVSAPAPHSPADSC